jgi:hypothetical protein
MAKIMTTRTIKRKKNKRLLNYEIPRPCQSAWNTPLLLVHDWCQAPMITAQYMISEQSIKQQ